MTEKEFLVYVDHFKNKRYDAVTSYFAPDVAVEYFTTPGGDPQRALALHGPQGSIQN